MTKNLPNRNAKEALRPTWAQQSCYATSCLLLLCLFFVVSRHDEKESLPTSTNHKKMIHELR